MLCKCFSKNFPKPLKTFFIEERVKKKDKLYCKHENQEKIIFVFNRDASC